MNNEDKKERFTLWMKHSTFEKVEENYREDNCQKKSEFIENAVNFYCGYLKMNSSEPFLSTVLRETLKKLIKAVFLQAHFLPFRYRRMSGRVSER